MNTLLPRRYRLHARRLGSQLCQFHGLPQIRSWGGRGFRCASLIFVLLPLPALAQDSMGPAGVNALVLHTAPYDLTGRKIAIGQVELGRPGKFGFDKVSIRSQMMRPGGLFFRDRPAKSDRGDTGQGDREVDAHAHKVASIMVSGDKVLPGVAPGARLYSAGVGSIQNSGQSQECRAANHIAMQNGEDVRAINFSFGESLARDPRPNAQLDGNALLTLCVDWSARVHDVLYVVAGNQGEGGIPIPTDNFNGVNVAFSARWDGVFRKVDFANVGGELASVASLQVGRERNLNQRRSIDLVAPGSELALINPNGEAVTSSGTSFAAPHVTAAVALLQEYGDRQLAAATPGWNLVARRHEVTKAVLLNSADKLQDEGNGHFLAMERTLLNQRGQTWLQSPAYGQPAMPLDLTMGAGHLNVFRAYEQFKAGQFGSDPGIAVAAVPDRGWDYNQVAQAGAGQANPVFRDYVFQQPLEADSYLSATLVWDRQVELVDLNGNGAYDLGETFQNRGLNNLDLFLLPVETTDTAAAVASSVSPVDSTEHLFVQVPQAGFYKVRVQYQDQTHGPVQPYGLAWWTQPQQP
ncbi:S8 family serine peptidase [Prochlorothrix hollandica]|uniref:S8 family serine peptidase n=1 Tax=Prochlorothrix hollandica TaxID=1223 RepID=UPI00334071E8